jgi:hypothetical protein
MRFIPTKVHGVLDYGSVLLCLILPRALNLSERTITLLTIVGLTALVYTILTRFELGVVRVLPTKIHLLLDFLSGALLCAAPFLIVPNASQTEKTILIVLGLFEIGAALMTRTRSPLEETHATTGLGGLPQH